MINSKIHHPRSALCPMRRVHTDPVAIPDSQVSKTCVQIPIQTANCWILKFQGADRCHLGFCCSRFCSAPCQRFPRWMQLASAPPARWRLRQRSWRSCNPHGKVAGKESSRSWLDSSSSKKNVQYSSGNTNSMWQTDWQLWEIFESF